MTTCYQGSSLKHILQDTNGKIHDGIILIQRCESCGESTTEEERRTGKPSKIHDNTQPLCSRCFLDADMQIDNPMNGKIHDGIILIQRCESCGESTTEEERRTGKPSKMHDNTQPLCSRCFLDADIQIDNPMNDQ
jgi:formylmethanofuran dehydrogenase subunit E